MHPVIPYVIAASLFGIGVYGVLVRRNAVLVLASVELMLGAVNLLLVTADVAPLVGDPSHTGQSFALFVIVVAAAEIGVGLALVLHLYRLRGSIDTDGIDVEAPPGPDVVDPEAREPVGDEGSSRVETVGSAAVAEPAITRGSGT